MRRNCSDRTRGRKSGERRRPLRTCLSLEALERRELLSVDVSAVGEGSGYGETGYGMMADDPVAAVLIRRHIDYKVTITNFGDAEPVVLTQTLDPRFQHVEVYVSRPDYRPLKSSTSIDKVAGVVTVTLPELQGTGVVHVSGQVAPSPDENPAPPVISNFSITTASPNESDQTSGRISVDAANPVADLSLAVLSDPGPVPQIVDTVYSFVLTNNSTTQTIPHASVAIAPSGSRRADQLGFSADRNPGWDEIYHQYVLPGDPFGGYHKLLMGYEVSVGDLEPGESKTATLTLRPKGGGYPDPQLEFTAIATSGAYEVDTSANNTVEVTTPLAPTAYVDLGPTKTDPFPTPVGRDLTYTMNFNTHGPDRATGVVVRQTLPAGATFVSASEGDHPVPGVVDNGTLVMTLPRGWLDPLVVTLSTTGIAEPGAPTLLSAPVEVTWNEYPGSLVGEVAMGTLAPRGYVGNLLEQDDPSIHVHQPQTYSYTLSNPDTFASSPLTAILTFPPASILALAPGGYTVEQTPTSQIVTFKLAGLAAGETRRLQVVSVPVSPAPTGVNVVARLIEEGRPEDYYPASSISTTIAPSVDLEATLSPGRYVNRGDQQTMSVTNHGPNTATGVEVQWNTVLPPWVGPLPYPPYKVETLSVGTLEVGQTVVLDVSQYVFFIEYFDGLHLMANEPSVAPGSKPAPYGFVSWLSVGAPSVETGGLATFTMRTMNVGPMDAENVLLTAEVPAFSRFLWASPGVVFTGDHVTLDVGKLAVGEEVDFQFVVSPVWGALDLGALYSHAMVSAGRHSLNPSYSGRAEAVVPVTAGPSGALVPGSPSYEAPENAGAIVVTVNRLGGASGPLSVNYATEAVDAVAGVDFRPVSATLVFEDGETSKTITVPILDNPSSAVDRTARLVFSNGQTTLLTIRDLDHGRAMPPVADIQWVGPPRGIAAIQVELARPLPDPSAFDPSAFALTTAHPGLMRGARSGRPIPLRSLYDPSTSTVVLTPRRPLPANLFYRLTVAGGGPTPGSEYSAELARGRNLRYVSAADDLVTLRLRGRGYIDALLAGPDQDERLSVVSLGPRQASVSRRVVQVHPRGFGPSRFQPPSRPTLARGWFAATAMRGSA